MENVPRLEGSQLLRPKTGALHHHPIPLPPLSTLEFMFNPFNQEVDNYPPGRSDGGILYFNTFTASVARLSIVFGNSPIQNMPAMQITSVNLAGPDSKIGVKSAGASWLQ